MQDLTVFHLLLVAQNLSNYRAIQAELAQIGNPGEFLDYRRSMLSSFSSATEQRNPRGDEYLFLLQSEIELLLDDIFALEECQHEVPERLASTV
ncbi:hypothetical protein AOLI_G00143660 [Acnodon oligacanthus]